MLSRQINVSHLASPVLIKIGQRQVIMVIMDLTLVYVLSYFT